MLKLSNNTYLIEGPNCGQYPYSNFIYIDDRIQTLLDTGWGGESLKSLGNRAIDLIINSHFHLDHRGNNHAFPGARVCVHRLDAPAMRSRDVFIDYYFGSFSKENVDTSHIEESPVHKEFEDNDLICLGEVNLQVIHTPGHTPGHCAFFWKDEGILYGGDIDLSKGGPFYGTMASNIDSFISSIKKLKDLNPRIYVSAHKGLITEDITASLDTYLNHIYEREARILDSLAIPRKLEELTMQKIISRSFGEPEELYYKLEMYGIVHHLERLMKSGQIVQDGDYYLGVKP